MEKTKEAVTRSYIKKFNSLLRTYEDDEKNYMEYRNFFKSLKRENPKINKIPTVEFMTILKNEKPRIYHGLKKHSGDDLFMEMVLELEMDYAAAKAQIEQIYKN